MSGALVVQADALRLPLPDESVDLVVTSPPYFALRSYSTEHKAHEIGSEPTPQLFLEALWAATAEMARVLKPTGSMFIDLGDKYSGFTNGQGKGRDLGRSERGIAMVPDGPVSAPTVYGVPNKSLMLLPERYRVGCVDRLGLIARAVICWSKPNGLPESVTDRVRRSHEDWVHLVKAPRYYSAIDEVREPQVYPNDIRNQAARKFRGDEHLGPGHHLRSDPNPLGKLPGSVWTIPSEPLRLPDWLGVDHYAAFPSEWPRRLILGWSPPGICLECGQGRVPVVDRRTDTSDRPNGYQRSRGAKDAEDDGVRPNGSAFGTGPSIRGVTEATILGYACSCTPYTDHPGTRGPGFTTNGQHKMGATGRDHNTDMAERRANAPWREYHLQGWTPPPTRPAVVLDPFSGTGTTIGVARQLGRIGIGVDLSHAYCRAARYRVFQSGDFGKAEARTWADRQGALL